MKLVKGSKSYRVKVVEYRLRHFFILFLCLLMAIVSAIYLSYETGHKKGMSGQEAALEDVVKLRRSLVVSKTQAEELDQQLANARTAGEVDRQANEGVRQEVISLKDEIARLSEENSFYRGLMAPTEKASGLTLGAVELVSSGGRAYDYKIVVQQLARRHEQLSGFLNVTIVGQENGVETTYSLSALSPTIKGDDIRLRFKYFQVVEGKLTIPPDFEPAGIEIKARKTGKKPQSISKKFGWLVEER